MRSALKLLCVILLTLGLAGCSTGPQLGLGIGFGPDGMTVSPTVRGNVGGVDVGVSGNGASAGTNIGPVGVGVGGSF
ncbi:MAG: hypothetical protein ACRC6I_04920 [Paracoccaceae bacterium]